MSPNDSRILAFAMRVLTKGRMSAGHSAMHADLQALHDAHPHLREHLAPILAKHGPKPAKAPKAPRTPKPVDPDAVNDHVVRLKYHIGDDHAFRGVHAELAAHPIAHVHAVAQAMTGRAGRTKKESSERILSFHNARVLGDAKEAARAGRSAG